MTFVTDLMQQRIDAGFARREDFRGCTEREIAQLEERLCLTLPEVFKDYLRVMGHEPAGAVPGSDIRFGCLHLLTGELHECAAEGGVAFSSVTLPKTVFALFAHQGYDYLYIDLAGIPSDPPVLRYHIGYGPADPTFDSLTEYLTWLVKGGSVDPAQS